MTIARTLSEWKEFYKLKSGDDPLSENGRQLFYLGERGYCLLTVDAEHKMVVVAETCGDGRFWNDFGEIIGKLSGCHCVATLCTRKIKPYIRAFGWSVEKAWACISNETKEVEERYLCRDTENRPVVITQAGPKKDGEPNPNYWVTHYIDTTEAPELTLSAGAVEITKDIKEQLKGGE